MVAYHHGQRVATPRIPRMAPKAGLPRALCCALHIFTRIHVAQRAATAQASSASS